MVSRDLLLGLTCVSHRRFQSFPGRRCPGHWIESHRARLTRLPSGPARMGYGVCLHLALDDIDDGQKYYIHGFNAREPLGNLMCQIMRPGDAALDVGANVGYFMVMLSLLAGKSGKVFALSRLHVEEVTVPSRTLDSLLPELPRIRLVKIDVEGAEMLALRGMEELMARDRPHLLVEVTDSLLRSLGATKHALVDHMLARGYAAFRVGGRVEPYEHRDGYQCDVLFVPEKSPAVAFDERRANFRQFLAQGI
jgi:hypothetical protein